MLFGDLAVPGQVDVVQRPRVLEGGGGCLGADGRGLVMVGIERRVEIDQVYRRRIHAAHDVQVVARPHGPVRPVGFTHDCVPVWQCCQRLGNYHFGTLSTVKKRSVVSPRYANCITVQEAKSEILSVNQLVYRSLKVC